MADQEILQNASTTLGRAIADLSDLSFTEIAILLFSRDLITARDAARVLEAGKADASTDIQQAVVRRQQHEALIAALLAAGPIRFFSAALELPFENIKQSYLEAVSDKRRLVTAFMRLPQANDVSAIQEMALKQTLSAQSAAADEQPQAKLPRYMTRGGGRLGVARADAQSAGRLVQDFLKEMTPQQRLEFSYARALLEGEVATLNGTIGRLEQFIRDVKHIARNATGDDDFDRRMLVRLKRGCGSR